MIGRILFGYYYIIIYFLCLVGGQSKVSLFGFSSSVVLFVHASSSFLSYSNHHPLAFVMKRSSLVLLRQQFAETLIDKKFQAYDSMKRRNKRNVCLEPQQNLQYRMSMMLYESLSSIQNQSQRRQGNTKKRRRKKSDNNNNNIHPNNDPKQKSIINSNTHLEQTVVILYYKPSNVITSHSNSDQIASPKKKKMDHPNKHDNQSDNNNHQQRVTVYDDIMSMKGYIPSTIINNNNRDSIANTAPDDSDNQRTKNYMSFSQVTGIQSKLHAVGRLDADTTGLLLLTNDGGLVHHVTNPTASSSFTSTQKISKTYEALIMGHHTLDNYDTDNNNRLQCMKEEGINIGPKYGGQTQPPTELEILSHPTNKTTLVQISIEEGKNRQIRRMFHAIQSGVIKLHRSQIARKQQPPLTLDGLSIGQWRLLSKEEIELSLGWNIRTLPQPPSVSSFPPKKNKFKKKRRRQTSK